MSFIPPDLFEKNPQLKEMYVIQTNFFIQKHL